MIKQYIKILITLMMSITIIISPCISRAVEETEGDSVASTEKKSKFESIEEARLYLASWAEGFVNKYGYNAQNGLCWYPGSNLYSLRGQSYKNYPSRVNGHYYFDCVGWVSFAIHGALGLYFWDAASGNNGHVMTESVQDSEHFYHLDSISQAQRGDILQSPSAPHVAIYLGNGKVADMWQMDNGGSSGLQIRSLNGWTMSGWSSCTFTQAVRLKNWDGAHPGALPDGANIVPTGSLSSDYVQPQFQYSGMATTVSTSQNKGFVYYIQKIGELYDYMIGIMFNAMKSIPISIADGIQGIITDALNFLSGN